MEMGGKSAVPESRPTVPLLEVLKGGHRRTPPMWLMRQAGRYLPEYRAIREKAKSFLDFCYQPELATEATLQPIRRFGFDAAIIFSDILVIPDALGQPVKFVEGEGPRLEPLPLGAVSGLDRGRLTPHLAPVYTALREVRSALAPETALIGFAGAPWTLATYMVAGKGTPDQAFVRKAAYAEPERFQTLIDVLVDAVSEHLVNQVKAGADALQIFDSWAGNLDGDAFMRWTVAPIAEIVRRVKAAVPGVPIIGFPRGGGTRLMAFARETGVDAVGLDWTVSLNTAAVLQHSVPVQGNLDPLRLVVGGRALDEALDEIMTTLAGGPFVFNLGHGILPETPIAHVERMIARVRRGQE